MMCTIFLLVLALSLVSAVPKDMAKWNPQESVLAEVPSANVFGMPERSDNDTAIVEEQSAQSTIVEHLNEGAGTDTGPFRKFWEALRLKANFLQELPDLQQDHLTDLSAEDELPVLPEVKFSELDFLPDIKILKYEVPPLPEVVLETPDIPDVQMPDLQVIEYEMPEIAEYELPPIPDIQLPGLKVLQYELPPLPESDIPQFPELPEVKIPDIKVINYELPSLPEIKTPEFPQLAEIELPDLKLVNYELPDFPEINMDLPSMPELQWPDIKWIKYELPSLPDMFDWTKFPYVKATEEKVPLLKRQTDLTSVRHEESDVHHEVMKEILSEQETGTHKFKTSERSTLPVWPLPEVLNSQMELNEIPWFSSSSSAFDLDYLQHLWAVDDDEMVEPWIQAPNNLWQLEGSKVPVRQRPNSKFTVWHNT